MYSVESPSSSRAVSSMEILSPPPTPGRKRTCRRTSNRRNDVPMFFSSANSVLYDEISSDKEQNKTTFDSLARLLSAQSLSSTAMKMTLKARPIYGTKLNKDQIQRNNDDNNKRKIPRVLFNETPSLPFDFTIQQSNRAAENGLATLPEETMEKMAKSRVSSQVNKTQSFHHSGMMIVQPPVVDNRKNCYVARCAWGLWRCRG